MVPDFSGPMARNVGRHDRHTLRRDNEEEDDEDDDEDDEDDTW